MRESIEDQQFPDSAKTVLAAATKKIVEPPRETELVLVALLMRLYDVNLALLTHFDEEQAGKIYEAHEQGEHFNPPMFIPTLEETDVVQDPGPVA